MHTDEALVTIARFETLFEASLARGALEAIGIRALVPGEARGAFSTRHTPVVNELQVFESDREQALVALRRMQMRVVDSTED